MKAKLVVLLLCLYGYAFCQKVETLDRLNAKAFPESQTLTIYFDASNKDAPFKYLKDQVRNDNKQDLPKYFSYKDGNEENLTVLCQFKNPLSYRLGLSFKYSDDPNIKVVSDFFDSAAQNIPLSNLNARIEGLADKEISSTLMPEWIFALQSTQSGQAGYAAYLKEVGAAFAELEKYLVGSFDIVASGKTFEEHIYHSVTQLKGAQTCSDYKGEKTDADKVSQALKNLLEKELNNKLEALKKAIKDDDFKPTAPFPAYTDYAIKKLELTYKDIVAQKKTLFEAYDALLSDLNKVKFQNDKILLTETDMKFKSKKDLLITIVATPITVDDKSLKVTEKEKMQSLVTVIRKRSQVEVSAGVAFFLGNITYNTFGINADSVAAATAGQDTLVYRVTNSEDVRWAIPTVFLNYYRLAGEEGLWIFPQIGVGSGKKLPTVFVGVGYVIPNRFIISGGLANAFNQELKSKYSENGVLNQMVEVKDLYDIKWELRPYLSIQLKF